ncbi:hypothetical protein ACFS5L_36425 [Streptomyces phyllanthi]
MSKRQTRKMLQLMASGEPVEVTSAMASVKKLARLAHTAQQFGYEYADVRQGGGNSGALKMLIVPDPAPQARQRAAQNRARYPNAGDGVSLPPIVPEAFELLKARINFDLTGKSAEKRMGFGALGLTVGMAIGVARAGEDGVPFVIASWLGLMAILGVGFVVTRKRNARFAARLRAAGFAQVTDETGRVRYLPPGGQLPGHGNPFAAAVPAPAPAPAPAPGPAPAAGPAQAPAPGPYQAPAYQGQQPAAYPPQGGQAGPYGGPYGDPYSQQYGAPQHPGQYGQPQPNPYAQPQPQPQHWQGRQPPQS